MWFAAAALAIGYFTSLEAGKQKRKAREAEASAIQNQRDREAIDILEGIDDLTGKQVSSYLKSGVEAHTGSPFQVIASSAHRAVQDARELREHGAVEASYIRERAGYEERAGQISALGGVITGGLAMASRTGTAGEGGSSSSSSTGVSGTGNSSGNYLGGFSVSPGRQA